MCFHSKQSKKAQQVENRFNAKIKNKDLFKPTNHYNGFTYPLTPIITNEDVSVIQMVNWGLLPNWADTNWNKSYTLNARIETLDSKPSFKNILQNRCIIIVNGFYEWQHIGNQKIKYEIGYSGKLFAFGGLYDINDGYKSYTIITKQAKGVMQEIHNTKLRMPLTLKSDLQMQNWLSGKDEVGDFEFTTNPKLITQTQLFI